MPIVDTIFEAYDKTPGYHYAGVTIESPEKLYMRNNTFKGLECSEKYVNFYSKSGGAIGIISSVY